ncbi:MAG TPA: hypothetical protein VIK40_09495 [Geomonas sp.]
MKNSRLLPSLMLFVAVMMLSGCIFPYWGDEWGGYHHGGHHHDGYGDRGRGGERR